MPADALAVCESSSCSGSCLPLYPCLPLCRQEGTLAHTACPWALDGVFSYLLSSPSPSSAPEMGRNSKMGTVPIFWGKTTGYERPQLAPFRS